MNPPKRAKRNEVPMKFVRVVADFVRPKFMYPLK